MARRFSDESYVIDICDELLGKRAHRRHRFDFLRGDPGKSGRRMPLPVDAYYPDLELVVEYMERQHFEAVKFFDRRATVSGMSRGEQRRWYDRLRQIELPKHGIELIQLRHFDFECTSQKRLLRQPAADREVVRSVLIQAKYL